MQRIQANFIASTPPFRGTKSPRRQEMPMSSMKSETTFRTQFDKALGSGASDRLEGKLKTAVGSAKVAAGQWLGDASLNAQGRRERAEGEVQQAAGKVKAFAAEVSDKASEAADALREKATEMRDQAAVVFDEVKSKTQSLVNEARRKR
jgi:uncharacterized protein YjbJ (UPF0337 family)